MNIMQRIDSKILSRIYSCGQGCVVSPGDFLDLGSRRAVDLALYRVAKKGTLRHLGQRHTDDAVLARLQRRLSASDKKVLLRDLRYAPAWIAAILRRVAGPEEK